MVNKLQLRMKVIPDSEIRRPFPFLEVAFYDEDGEPLELGGSSFTPAEAVADFPEPEGRDFDHVTDTVYPLMDKVNELIGSLRTAGLIDS